MGLQDDAHNVLLNWIGSALWAATVVVVIWGWHLGRRAYASREPLIRLLRAVYASFRKPRHITITLEGLRLKTSIGQVTATVTRPPPDSSPSSGPPGWPPGNAGATAMANQDFPGRRILVMPMPQDPVMNPAARIARGTIPLFANSPQWMSWEAARQQHGHAARFGMY